MSWLAKIKHQKSIGNLIRWFFVHMSFIIPLQHLYESETLLAFHHPTPTYPLHILIVPRKDIRGLQNISAGDAGLLLEIFQVAHALVKQFDLEKGGYRLIANGGAYQEIPLLHFHLIADHDPQQEKE
jgi:histidine triad (HIT) family protein